MCSNVNRYPHPCPRDLQNTVQPTCSNSSSLPVGFNSFINSRPLEHFGHLGFLLNGIFFFLLNFFMIVHHSTPAYIIRPTTFPLTIGGTTPIVLTIFKLTIAFIASRLSEFLDCIKPFTYHYSGSPQKEQSPFLFVTALQ